jgi:signal transduction histidine kinase
MFTSFFNWRTALGITAIAIVIGTIFYSNYLSKKIAIDERKKVEVWVQSLKTRAEVTEQAALNLTSTITDHNTDIPIIETDEKDNPSGQTLNMDTLKIKKDATFLQQKIIEFKNQHPPIQIEISKDPLMVNKYYYGDSTLFKEVRYYPIVQLLILALFIFITLFAIATKNKSTQNQVWAGMAKETAHQLGTPLSSLQGWVEMLKENPDNQKIGLEMAKDVDRLKLVSDRFGKIGSTPKLETKDVLLQVQNMIAYIKRRAPEKVNFILNNEDGAPKFAQINEPLFDWVIENLLKNALDAMDGKGSITVTLTTENNQTIIDVFDTGKGIAKQHINKVFSPGFTTKKRGWGLGLSLSKRIVEQYHKGSLFVKSSEVNTGTTFRIVLKN